MTVSIQPLYDIINNKVALPATKPVELMQLSEAAKMLDSIVYRVANLAALPPAAENKGRLIWVDDIQNYRYSNGTTWSIEYNSTQVINNDIWTWGNNASGRLGDNTIADKSSPVSVVGGFTDWSQVSASGLIAIAIRIYSAKGF